MRSISGRSGIDPDYVSVVEVFDNLSHTEIHEAVSQLDPAALSHAAQVFLATSTGFGDSVEDAHSEIRAAIADGWRGAAAQRAADAVREFEQAGRGLADVLTAVGVRLSQAGDAAESLRVAVAEPDGTQPDPNAALLNSQQAADNAALVRQAENARLDAVAAMESIYAGAFLPTGTGVPAFPEIGATGVTDPTVTSTPVSGIPTSPLLGTSAPGTPTAGAPATSTTDPESNPTTPATVDPATATTTASTATIHGTTTAASTSTAGTTVPAATAPLGTEPNRAVTPTAPGATATPAPTTYPGTATVGTDPRTRRDRPTGSTPAVHGRNQVAPDQESGAATAPGEHPGVSGSTPGTPTSTNPVPTATTTAASTSGITAATTDGDSTETAVSSADSMVDGRPAAGGEMAAGMGAGAVGGLMGGAMAAADHTRQPGGPRKPPPEPEPEDEDDEFLRFLDEEPTYLEPADEVNALIGKLEPTSPPVLGEWTERE